MPEKISLGWGDLQLVHLLQQTPLVSRPQRFALASVVLSKWAVTPLPETDPRRVDPPGAFRHTEQGVDLSLAPCLGILETGIADEDALAVEELVLDPFLPEAMLQVVVEAEEWPTLWIVHGLVGKRDLAQGDPTTRQDGQTVRVLSRSALVPEAQAWDHIRQTITTWRESKK